VSEASASVPTNTAQLHRSYRFMFSASVSLAAIGAPLLMQGVVALVASFENQSATSGGSLVRGFVLFTLSAVPMTLAWLAWRRTQQFQRFIDLEP
jgi:hypothetical protein